MPKLIQNVSVFADNSRYLNMFFTHASITLVDMVPYLTMFLNIKKNAFLAEVQKFLP